MEPGRLKELNIISSFKNENKDGSLKSARIGYEGPISLALFFCNPEANLGLLLHPRWTDL